jgi:integrase
MPLYRRKPNGVYYFSITDPQTGKRTRGSTKQKKRYLAQLVLDEKRQQAKTSGVASLTHRTPTLTAFSVDFLKWVEDTNSIQASTKKFYQHGWKLLSTTKLAGMKLDAIAEHDCDTTAFPGGPWHANQALRTLRRILSLAKEMKRIYGESLAVPLRNEVRRSAAMTFSDASLIAAKMPTGDAKDAFLVIRGTGMRPGEVFCMSWDNVKWETAQYQNPRGKTKSARRPVPLLNDSLSVLRRRHLAEGMPREGWVFPSDSVSGHMTTIAKAFTKARDAAGVPKIYVLYSSRHGAMTDLARVVPLSEVMNIGGHSDARTAIGYQHSETPKLQEKLDALRALDTLDQAPATELLQ